MTNKLITVLFILSFLSSCTSTDKQQNSESNCNPIAEQDKWKTIADNPRWGDALVGSILGVKDISRSVTGGVPMTSTVYDWYGKMYFETKNQNGEIVKVLSPITGCLIGMKEYHEKKIYFNKIYEAPGYK